MPCAYRNHICIPAFYNLFCLFTTPYPANSNYRNMTDLLH